MRAMKRPTRAALAALLVIVASLTSGGALAQSPTDLGPLTAAPWQLTQMNGSAVPANAGITAAFTEDGHLSGSAGCNDYNATYSVDASGGMSVGPIAETRKACADDINARERGYLDALQATSTWAIRSGTLTLTNPQGNVLSYVGPKGIEGSWTLLSIGGAQVPSTITATADFGSDGTVNGNGGCNDYNATYTAEGADGLTVSGLSATRKACDLSTSGIEALFLDGLQAATNFSIANDQLTIRTASGDLVFAAGATLPTPSGAPLPTIEPLPSGGPVPSMVPPGAGSIVGTWQLIEMAGQAIPPSVISVIVTFSADGKVTGNGGCNDFGGTYTLEGTKIALAMAPTTTKTCDATRSAMEQGVMAILPYVDDATVADGQLTLASSGMGFSVVFAPAP
jgi:heat shock protein HslJ